MEAKTYSTSECLEYLIDLILEQSTNVVVLKDRITLIVEIVHKLAIFAHEDHHVGNSLARLKVKVKILDDVPTLSDYSRQRRGDEKLGMHTHAPLNKEIASIVRPLMDGPCSPAHRFCQAATASNEQILAFLRKDLDDDEIIKRYGPLDSLGNMKLLSKLVDRMKHRDRMRRIASCPPKNTNRPWLATKEEIESTKIQPRPVDCGRMEDYLSHNIDFPGPGQHELLIISDGNQIILCARSGNGDIDRWLKFVKTWLCGSLGGWSETNFEERNVAGSKLKHYTLFADNEESLQVKDTLLEMTVTDQNPKLPSCHTRIVDLQKDTQYLVDRIQHGPISTELHPLPSCIRRWYDKFVGSMTVASIEADPELCRWCLECSGGSLSLTSSIIF